MTRNLPKDLRDPERGDYVNEYKWSINLIELSTGRKIVEEGDGLKHHYQDGPLVLISKILDEAGYGP